MKSATNDKSLTTQALRWRIRSRKEDSALVYALFESYEGWLGYSTLDHEKGSAYRDLELQVPIGYGSDVKALLQRLGDLIYVIESPEVDPSLLP